VPKLSLELLPAQVYLEHASCGQLLNFDLSLGNGSDEAYRLTSIALEVAATGDALTSRREVGEQGLRPPIDTVPDRVVPPGGSLLVFNPLHTFGPHLDLAHVLCLCQLTGESGLVAQLAAEASPRHYDQRTELFLPLTGRVLIANGHDFLSPHRRIDPAHPLAAALGVRVNSGRFADDYSIAGRDGEATGLGADVRAPGAGVVVAAVADVPDNTRLPEGGVEFAGQPADPAATIFGNHVVIDHGDGEFSVLGHLEHRSLQVRAGDRVDAKQPLARLGLSGNTDFPHVHYQLQDGPDARTAEGLPFRFGELGPLEPGTILVVA
jgi:hypothetical protein